MPEFHLRPVSLQGKLTDPSTVFRPPPDSAVRSWFESSTSLDVASRFVSPAIRYFPVSRNSLTLPGFDVDQIIDNYLMNGGRNGQEGEGAESAVHG